MAPGRITTGGADSLSIGVPKGTRGNRPMRWCLLWLRRPDRRAIGPPAGKQWHTIYRTPGSGGTGEPYARQQLLLIRGRPCSGGRADRRGSFSSELAMGPIALFDKSFLQSLSVDESVWFDHFFLANVCPIFYAETQADLAKEDGKSLTPEELVGRIAAKFPDFSGSPNVHHRTMCTASLLGHEVPLRPQIILPRGCHATVSGHPVAILPESPEARAFLRWTQGQFEEEERQAAAEWRQSSHGYETPEVIDALRKLKAFDNAPCSTLGGVRDATDEALRRLTEEQKVWLV